MSDVSASIRDWKIINESLVSLAVLEGYPRKLKPENFSEIEVFVAL